MKPVFALSFCLLLGTVAEGRACSCVPPPPPKQALEQAAAVFSAKVVDFKQVTEYEVEVQVEILNTWKGTTAKTLKIYTARDGGECGYAFKVGEQYLIYCQVAEKKLYTHICTRTKALKQADEDLKDLGAGQPPVEETKPD